MTMLLADIETVSAWERIAWMLVGVVVIPLGVLICSALATQLLMAVWVRLPRRRRATWIGLILIITVVGVVASALTDDMFSESELEQAPPHAWHRKQRFGIVPWLEVDERNSDVLYRKPPISRSISIDPLGVVLNVPIVIAAVCFGWRAWRWNVGRFTLRDTNRCPECGHDLRGNPEGVTGCPECGWGREDEGVKG